MNIVHTYPRNEAAKYFRLSSLSVSLNYKHVLLGGGVEEVHLANTSIELNERITVFQ
jgi:hypothetical protein